MRLDFLLETFAANCDQDAIVWRDRAWNYAWLLQSLRQWQARIEAENIAAGSVVLLEADFSPNALALWLALVENGCVIVPLAHHTAVTKAEFMQSAQAEIALMLNTNDELMIRRTGVKADNELYAQLRAVGHPGLVLFSSGSTGKYKGIVHDLQRMLEQYRTPRKARRTISFLLFDHIGGVDTMLYILANAGCMITVERRTPDAVLAAVEKYKAELLPTSPTFIHLILLSEAWKRFDLTSLRIINYGTEPMPESTLKRLHELLPNSRLQQTYGLSELGILHSRSKSSDSLWLRLGGDGFETRVVEGTLQIKAKSAMLGYLNAPNPFTTSGWFDTGDLVEVDGYYVRFLGRQTEIINVGGEKVFPKEIEAVIRMIDNVGDVLVYGEKNPITGDIVCADVVLRRTEDHRQFARRVKALCRAKMENYKVPVKVNLVAQLHGERFKKVRGAQVRDLP